MNSAEQTIREIIEKEGSIPFPAFMELALYHATDGYYEKVPDIGKMGDFYTSVSVGPVFGAVIASWALTQCLLRTIPEPLMLVEVGAHDGSLAYDVLSYLETYAGISFQYCIVEPSRNRTIRQKEKLSNWGEKVRWYSTLNDLPGVKGVIFSNELLDAFPCHRLVWSKSEKRWLNSHVVVEEGKFEWRLKEGNVEMEGIEPGNLRELEPVLPEGYTVETSPTATAWWREAAAKLQHGFLLTFDYGFGASGQFSPERTKGTLRGYSAHQTSDPLQNPGEQDITYHVQFDAIREAGEKRGLETLLMDTQERFLMNFVLHNEVFAKYLGENPARIRQLMTLCSPAHLGKFRCLIQKR